MTRSSWPVALFVAAALIAGAVVAARLGPATSPVAAPDGSDPAVRSSVWYCPHGGGAGWRGTLSMATPGSTSVSVRVTSLDERAPSPAELVEVAPDVTTTRPLDVSSASAATVVEVFDGFVGVGYRLIAGGDDTGLGAEPCIDVPSANWWASGLTTVKGDRAMLVVANPFRSQAVFDISLFTPDAPPLRDTAWSDIRLAPGRSAVFDVSRQVPGKQAVTALIEASVGRTVVGTLTVTAVGGVRSSLATPAQAARWFVPVVEGSGQVELGLGVSGEDAVRFSATLRTSDGPATGGLIGVRQGALSSAAYALTTVEPSGIELTTDGGAAVSTGAIARGESADDAATGGMDVVATTWLVPPTVGQEPWFPGLVVANPGDTDVRVHVVTLPSSSGSVSASATFTVKAGASGGPPRSFLDSDPEAMILVSATGPVIALGGSTSSGLSGLAWYALAGGVPVPAWAVSAADAA